MNHGWLIIAFIFGITVITCSVINVNKSSEGDSANNANVNRIVNGVKTRQYDHTNVDNENVGNESIGKQDVNSIIDKSANSIIDKSTTSIRSIVGTTEFGFTNIKKDIKYSDNVLTTSKINDNKDNKSVYGSRNLATNTNLLGINYDEQDNVNEIYVGNLFEDNSFSRKIRSISTNISDIRSTFSNNSTSFHKNISTYNQGNISSFIIKENPTKNISGRATVIPHNQIEFSIKNRNNRYNVPDKRSALSHNGNRYSGANGNILSNSGGVASGPPHECGGLLTSSRGVISTPGFPEPFPTPLHCTWVIVNSVPEQGHIAVYLTQLYAFTGLVFTEYAYYDEEYRAGGRKVHEVTEENVTNVKWIEVSAPYLVIEFHMSSIKSGQHLRALDFLLNVYGFNITFEIRPFAKPENANFDKGNENDNASVIDPATRCNVLECRYLGHCLANADFTKYSCVCFPGYSGPDCGEGPLCKSPNKNCENGATCKHLGSAGVTCQCTAGFEGDKCDIPVLNNTQKDCPEKNIEALDSPCSVICPNSENNDELCTCKNGRAPEPDLFRYEVTFHLANTTIFESGSGNQKFDPVKMAEEFLLQELPSYVKTSFRDLKVIYMRLGFHLVFHFFSSRNSSDEITAGLNLMASLGWLGTLPLVARPPNIKREPLIYIHSVKINRPTVDEGQEFILSCMSQGPSRSSFRWYKDGSFINRTMATRSMWTLLHPHTSHQNVHSRGETHVYTAMLSIHQATPLDSGVYSCRVSDDLLKIKTCKDIVVKVKNKVKVRLEPQAQTVYKGQSLTIRCLPSGGSVLGPSLGYSWTQDGALFPNDVSGVMWEDLRPYGSVLKIEKAQRSHTYSCHVTNAGPTTSKSLFVTVVDAGDNVCPSDYEYGIDGITDPLITWPFTAPGVSALSSCPLGYTGQAVRLCEIHYTSSIGKPAGYNLEARWKQADYSDCVADELEILRKDYHNLRSGYTKASASEISTSIAKYLHLRTSDKSYLAGEFLAAVQLLRGVLEYTNATGILAVGAANSGRILVEGMKSINSILKSDDGILGDENIRQLQDLVHAHGRIFSRATFDMMSPVSMKSHMASPNGSQELKKTQTTFQDGNHVSMASQMDATIKHRVKIRLSEIKVDFVKMEGGSLYIDLPASEPGDPWKGDAISIHVKNHETHIKNSSIFLMAATYHNITRMLPKLYSAQLGDGSDIEYIIVSRLSLIDFTTSRQNSSQVISIRIVMSHLPIVDAKPKYKAINDGTEEEGIGRYRKNVKRSADRIWEEDVYRNPSVINDQDPGNWKRVCAVSASGASTDGTGWSFDSCHLESEDENSTICVCAKAGTYAVLYVNMKDNAASLLLPFLPFILALLFIGLYILSSIIVFTLLALSAYGKDRQMLDRKGSDGKTSPFFGKVKKSSDNQKFYEPSGNTNIVSCRQTFNDPINFTNKQLFENPQMTDEELINAMGNSAIGQLYTDLEDQNTRQFVDNSVKENSIRRLSENSGNHGQLFNDKSPNLGVQLHGSGRQLYESGTTVRKILVDHDNDQKFIANFENTVHLLNHPEKVRTKLLINTDINALDGGVLFDISSDNKIISEELFTNSCKTTTKINDRRFENFGMIYYKLQCSSSSAFLGISLLYLITKFNYNIQYISFVISLLLLLLLWSQVLCLVDAHAKLSRTPAKFRRSARGLCIASSILCSSASPMINAVLGNNEHGWIPIIRTSSFIILTIGAVLVTILYGVLFVLTLRRLRVFRNCKKNVIITKSFAVLRRSGAVFCCCLLHTCSVLFFTQRPKNVASLALLSISCCVLSIAMIVCYIIKPETPVDYKSIRNIWRRRSKKHTEVDTTSNQLNSSKKQEGEIELENVTQQIVSLENAGTLLKNSKSKSCDLVLESYPQSPRAYVSGELKAAKCLYQHRSIC